MKGFKNEIRRRWYLRWMLIFSNWLFQGILHADRTEKIYRISCTLLFFSMILFLFYLFTPWNWMQIIVVSILCGHTLNWILNGNFSAILVHRLMLKKTTKNDLFNFVETLSGKLQDNKSLLYTAVFGSMSRGELKDSSDLDLSMVRNPGFTNAIKSLWLVLIVRKQADFKGIPLELFLSDSPENSINRFRNEDKAVVVFDPGNRLRQYYREIYTINEAKKRNGV